MCVRSCADAGIVEQMGLVTRVTKDQEILLWNGEKGEGTRLPVLVPSHVPLPPPNQYFDVNFRNYRQEWNWRSARPTLSSRGLTRYDIPAYPEAGGGV